MRKFAGAPQVGSVLTMSDTQEINYLYYMLQAEQLKRQQYYSQNGSDFLRDVKNKKC